MMNELIKPHLPDTVSLYYVDYRDSLDEQTELLEETLRNNSLDPIYDKVNDWWIDDDSTSRHIEHIQNSMAKSSEYELTDDDKDEIREWLYEKDDSTPVQDLLRNTSSVSMFYSLGLDVEGWSEPGFMCPSMRHSSVAQEAYKVRQKLGIKKGTHEAERITSIIENASYGGELRVYFSIPIQDALSKSLDEDFKSIHFKGDCTVAVYHSNGSGDYEVISLDKVFPFTRDNLFCSASDKYSIEGCFGMGSDWLRDSSDPIFQYEELRGAKPIKKSRNTEIHAREAEYKRVFQAGGCTYGDMDFNRHRDVYYKNEIPCGSHCPHCGTFWID